MDRINGADFVDIGGGRRGFRDEDLPTGVPGTEVTALFLNMLQEELAAVIADAGIALDPADWGQLLKALRSRSAGRPSWVPVISMTVTAPPASPAVGDRYVIPPGATGAWAGRSYEIAEWLGLSWSITNHADGHGVGLPDGRVFIQVGGAYVEKIALDTQSGKQSYSVTAGSSTIITATLDPVPLSLASLIGASVRVKFTTAPGANPTINFNGLGAISLRSADGAVLPANAFAANEFATLIYDGTVFRALNTFLRTGGDIQSSDPAKQLLRILMAPGQTAPPFQILDGAGNVRLTWDFTYGGLRVPNGLGNITGGVMLLAGATGSGHFTVTDGNVRQQVESGFYNAAGTGDTTLTFPIAFKSGTTPNVVVTPVGDGLNDTSTLVFFAKGVSSTGFTCAKRYANNGGAVGSATQPFFWTAVGQA